ncbi:hypothetical protein FPV67DRAFT_1411834 [Lyophyllum atratum]|nr:hypothetical protein FPV67DRAFT_1411834 [Lyophyllum atratum]
MASLVAHAHNSRFQVYEDFCNAHNISLAPTEDTISRFVAEMCKSRTTSYLCNALYSICHQLEPTYPGCRENCKLGRALSAALKPQPPAHVRRITEEKVLEICAALSGTSHDDKLFLVILLISFYGIVSIARLTADEDNLPTIGSPEIALRSTVTSHLDHNSFLLPPGKHARCFAENTLSLPHTNLVNDPLRSLKNYLSSRDNLFPLDIELWLRDDSTIPTSRWFLDRLQNFFPACSPVTARAVLAGSVTAQVQAGISQEAITARWNEDRQHSPCRIYFGTGSG